MNFQKNSINVSAQIIFALLAGTIFISDLPAQTAAQPVQNRLLLVFDTSLAMKKRLPAEQTAVVRLFTVTLTNQMQPGDSIGVWTFGQDLQTGRFPLQSWEPQNAMTISSNILAFVKSQYHSRTTRFDKLMPLLGRVVAGSERLTVLIFCDGDGQITNTPDDAAINAAFKQNQREMKKTRQPFVIVLRSQRGHYVHFTVNYPYAIHFPPFPLLPAPPAPTPVTPPPEPPQPQPAPQSLIIIGTNLPLPQVPPTMPVSPTAPTNSGPPANSVMPTNATASQPGALPAMPASNSVAPTNPASPANQATTKAAASTMTNSGINSGSFFAIGAGFLVGAGTLTFLILRRSSRRNSESLITHSLKK